MESGGAHNRSGPAWMPSRLWMIVAGSIAAAGLLVCGAGVAVFNSGSSSAPPAATEPALLDAAPPVAPTTEPTFEIERPPLLPETTRPAPRPTKTATRPTKPPKPGEQPAGTRPPIVTRPPGGFVTRPPGGFVVAGERCLVVGSIGVTRKGEVVRCTRKGREERARWRKV